MESQEKKEPRINNTSIFLMVSTAILFDLVSIIPIVGQVIAVVGSAVVFGFWFLTLGLPLLSPKKLITTLLSYLGEAFPAISAVPFITAGVVAIILITRFEDKTGIEVSKFVPSGKKLKPITPKPKLNDIVPNSA